MVRNIFLIVLNISIFLITNLSFAITENIKSLLEQAEKAYDSGDYENAVKIYEIIISHNHINGHIFYNLGNAYYKLGQKGNAIAAYLAAKKYIPQDPDLIANLNFVINSITDKLDIQSENLPIIKQVFFWTPYFTAKNQFITASVVLIIALLFIGIYIIFNKLIFKILAMIFLIIYFIIFSGFIVHYFNYEYWGAINADKAQVYSEPNYNNSNVLFELHDGAPFLWKKSYQDWFLIKLSDGKQGWVHKNNTKIYFK